MGPLRVYGPLRSDTAPGSLKSFIQLTVRNLQQNEERLYKSSKPKQFIKAGENTILNSRELT
jgi:hypothetical protein